MIDPNAQRNPLDNSSGLDVSYWHGIDPGLSGLQIAADGDEWSGHHEYFGGVPALALRYEDGATAVMFLPPEAMEGANDPSPDHQGKEAPVDDGEEVRVNITDYLVKVGLLKGCVGAVLGTVSHDGSEFAHFADTQLDPPPAMTHPGLYRKLRG